MLRAAADRFSARGYHGTTVEAIARQAGVNKALVSYHFGGKEQLYLAVRRHMLDLFSGLEAASRDRAATTWVDAITRQARQVPSLPRFLLREELGDGPAQAAEGSVLGILARRLARTPPAKPSPQGRPPLAQDAIRVRIILVALLFHLAWGGSESTDQPLPPFVEDWLTK